MITFDKLPDPNKPIGTYFTKQNKCISLLKDSDKPIILARRNRTLLAHMQSIPVYQPAISDYTKMLCRQEYRHEIKYLSSLLLKI